MPVMGRAQGVVRLEDWAPVALPGRKFVPIWSSDGRQMTFSVEEAGQLHGPWLLDLESRRLTLIDRRGGFTASQFVDGNRALLGFGRIADTGVIVRWPLPSGDPDYLVRRPVDQTTYPSRASTGALAWFESRDRRFVLRVRLPGADAVQEFGAPGVTFTGRPAAWTADGRTVVVATRVGGDPEVVRLDPATGTIEPLTNHPGPDFNPSLSPDGRTIAFIRGEPGAGERAFRIFLMDADGGHQRQLGTRTPIHGSLSWSPDGAWLAFNSYTEEGGIEIFAVRVNDGTAVQVTSTAS